MARNFLSDLEKRSKPFVAVVGLALVGAVGWLDYATGRDLTFSLFYLIPISLVGWLMGRWPGIMASVVSALVRMIVDMAERHAYSQPFFYVWNSLIGLSFFVIVALLLSALRKALDHQKELAHTDFLTGAVNARVFFDLLQMEINRFRRYKQPFTIVYFDMDNFKAVNDRFGHAVGDRALQTMVQQIRTRVRTTDVIARLGGDEFALLLPETTPAAAKVAVSKIRQAMMAGMQENDWPVTFSIGVLTCIGPPPTPVELVRLADELMYSVKRGSKDAIEYAIYGG